MSEMTEHALTSIGKTNAAEAADRPLRDEAALAEPPIAEQLDQNLDEASSEDVILAHPEWGSVSMLAAIQSLGGIIPGAGIIEAAHSNTFRTVEMHGDFSISNGGGSLEAYFLEQSGVVDSEGRKRDDDDGDLLDTYMEAAEQRAERKREMEEWSRSEHELAGVEMTGEEWGALSTAVGKNGALRQWLVNRLMKDGKTEAEAQEKANEYAEIYRIMAKPESQRTPDETKRVDAARHSPEFRAVTHELDQQKGAAFSPADKVEITTTGADQKTSVTSGADAFDADAGTPLSKAKALPVGPTTRPTRDFASAVNLVAHHEAALAATEPLDVPKANFKIAAAAPSPAPGGGFDL